MSRHSKREEEERDILGELGGWLVYILLIIGLTYLIITFVGQRTMVSGSSMETTLQDGDNLANLKMTELIDKYDVIAEELEMEYGISWMKNQKETAHFSRLELNITIETEYSFLTYLRFFKLLAYAVLKKGGVLSTFSTSNSFKRAIEIETLKCDRPTYALRIYNKSREISQKLTVCHQQQTCYELNFFIKRLRPSKQILGIEHLCNFPMK